MKKLLLVLLVVALAAFLLVGCIPGTLTPDDDGGGDGETEVGVVIEGAVPIDGKTYVSAGDHTITVTFPAPVAGVVTADITECTGDYSKQEDAVGTSVVLFPDATKKIWTGSGTFLESAECCASYIEVTSGECADLVCIAFPVIVDGELPYAQIGIKVANCDCPGCEIIFTSTAPTIPCEGTELCCGDDCSGLASLAINIYEGNPFNECCDPSF